MLRLHRSTQLLLTAALLLAGCGGDEPATDAPETDEASEQAAPDEASEQAAPDEDGTDASEGGSSSDVLAAAAAASTADSVRFTLTSTATTPQGEVLTTGEGISGPDGTGHFTLTVEGAGAQMPGVEGPLELETILVDGVIYQRNSAMLGQFGSDAEWYSIDPSETIPGFEQIVEQAEQADPTEALRVLRDAGQVEEVGTEEINGISTTHYRGQIELGVLLEGQGVDPEALGSATGDLDTDQLVPIDVWIDDEGRVRRTVQQLDVQGMGTETTVDILEYGVPVDVEPPPADVTVSLTELFEQMQQGGGSG